MELFGFVLIAVPLVASALAVVFARRLVNAVLWLGAMLALTAVLFVTLAAPLLGGLQLLLYVGGVMTLMIFGVMLTRVEDGDAPRVQAWSPIRGGIVALVLFGLMASAILRTVDLPSESAAPPSVAKIGEALLTTNVLAFEVLSVLLLAAMIGAIVLSRRSDDRAPAVPRVREEQSS
jgi:NADH-quinone oxidoreductase subunit J